MSNNSLQRFDKDGIELLIDSITGESFASASGYARMANKDQSTISRRLKGMHEEGVKHGETLTTTGVKTIALVNEDLIAEWLPKDNPSLASQLIKLGVRGFMHKLAGFEIKSTAINQESISHTDMFLMAAKAVKELEQKMLAQEQRLTAIEASKQEATEELTRLPLSADVAPTVSVRGKINMIVRNKAQRDLISYTLLWSKLYQEMYYRLSYDVKARCRNSGLKPLDQIERDKMFDALYAIASEVLA